MDIIIMGKAILVKPANVTGRPAFSAMLATTMLADAPISVPLPPRQAPRERDHHSGLRSVTPPSLPGSWISGIIVATKGILSTKADARADSQRISRPVEKTAPPVNSSDCLAIASIMPTCSSAPTIIADQRGCSSYVGGDYFRE